MKVWMFQDIDVDVNAVVDWMNRYARSKKLKVKLSAEGSYDQGGFLYIPATAMGNEGLFKKIKAIQKVEEAWNNQIPTAVPTVILVPSYASSEKKTKV